jgi:hypothetical protein
MNGKGSLARNAENQATVLRGAIITRRLFGMEMGEFVKSVSAYWFGSNSLDSLNPERPIQGPPQKHAG